MKTMTRSLMGFLLKLMCFMSMTTICLPSVLGARTNPALMTSNSSLLATKTLWLGPYWTWIPYPHFKWIPIIPRPPPVYISPGLPPHHAPLPTVPPLTTTLLTPPPLPPHHPLPTLPPLPTSLPPQVFSSCYRTLSSSST
ncbi:hypothetical protein Mapa_009677 [Marchantia paleacea]|nr:hypothetical protein Mapa_009677 [Marchantia paleacea]